MARNEKPVKAVTGAADERWVVSALLVALAARRVAKGGVFTRDDVRAWVPAIKTESQAKHTTSTLLQCGFVSSERLLTARAHTYTRYTVTAAGAAAIEAAGSGKRVTSGPKGPHQVDRRVGKDTLPFRLWSLMRVRGILDSETAVATLVDAGNDFKNARETAQRYLARWASAGALTVSRRREANGCIRYVLVKDTGPTPPVGPTKAAARRARAAAQASL